MWFLLLLAAVAFVILWLGASEQFEPETIVEDDVYLNDVAWAENDDALTEGEEVEEDALGPILARKGAARRRKPRRPKDRSLPGMPKGWNVRLSKDDRRYISFEEGGVRVDYPKGRVKAGPRSVVFPPAFKNASRVRRVRLFFSVKFSDDFVFTEGGKMPGIFMGRGDASGCQWSNDGASFRLGFSKNKNGNGGQVYPYVYYTKGKQLPSFNAIRDASVNCGVKLWNKGNLPVRRNAWNRVMLLVELNTPGKFDGAVGISVNGKQEVFRGMRWRNKASTLFHHISFSTFFGGSNIRHFAPTNACSAIFRDFRLEHGT